MPRQNTSHRVVVERRIDVVAVARSCLRLVGERAVRGRLDISTDMPPSLPAMIADGATPWHSAAPRHSRHRMACAYSLDLRRRVIEAIEGGLSTRAAARRFSIGISTAGAWYRRWRGTGDIRPGRQGQPPGSKLDAFEAFILGLVEERKDISLPEIAERLVEEHGVRAAPSTVWHFFDKREITYKKRRRMPRNSSARTSSSGAMPGSTARSISTPRG